MVDVSGSMTKLVYPEDISTPALASLSSKASSSSLVDPTERWCMESLKAIERHLFLLSQLNTAMPSVNTPAKFSKQHFCPSQNTLKIDILRASVMPLPHGWEQRLDLRTGKIYYIDWVSCKISEHDPRTAMQRANDMIQKLTQHAMAMACDEEAEGSDTQSNLTYIHNYNRARECTCCRNFEDADEESTCSTMTKMESSSVGCFYEVNSDNIK
ncbi:hypothetical protein KP509_11G038400 [Ceratopteris richardii]|uniref:WW domain-containing protein n=1 Tax=Ceratopteris richardii TaxID=49495 RepID=A0A8T2TNK6_CERRI|nr:hypothetical protein KP509_11G038400 [Ceratopteris richardii]